MSPRLRLFKEHVSCFLAFCSLALQLCKISETQNWKFLSFPFHFSRRREPHIDWFGVLFPLTVSSSSSLSSVEQRLLASSVCCVYLGRQIVCEHRIYFTYAPIERSICSHLPPITLPRSSSITVNKSSTTRTKWKINNESQKNSINSDLQFEVDFTNILKLLFGCSKEKTFTKGIIYCLLWLVTTSQL